MEEFVRFVMVQESSVCFYHAVTLEHVGPVLANVKNVLPPVHFVMELLLPYRIYTSHDAFVIKSNIQY